MNIQTPLAQAVELLNQLLLEETEALRRLDHETLDSLTERKVALLRELATVNRAGADRETLRAISLVRDRALNNQMLMVHARDLTQGVFDRMTGNTHGTKAGGSRLLEVRG